MLGLNFQTLVSSFLALSLLSSTVSTAAIDVRELLQHRQANGSELHWVDTWTSMPQLVEQNNLPPSPFNGGGAQFRDATLRQTLHMSVGADKIRIEISNTFGGSDLPVTAASIALPTGGQAGVAGIQADTVKAITFGGSASVVVPRGKVVLSDEIDFPVKPQSMISVSLYFQQGQSGSSITGHPGSRTTSWMQSGNRVTAATLSGSNTKHWYFISAVQALVPTTTSSLIILGDSITDGRGSDDDKNNRWPDLLLARMQSNGITNVAINNQAAGGNAVLSGGLGPTLMSRYQRDALTRPNVKYVMIFEGVNDLGNGPTSTQGANQLADQLTNAFKTIAADAHKLGYKVFAATITQFTGNGQSYGNPAREAARQRVNNWILTSGTFDAVIDFAKILGNPSNPSILDSKYDGGDHLHPNVAGYQAVANAFPLDIFK
ncbi:hypothetical protein M501DRAFT_970115 [Patellaria atrata CBS 101060]|uniref:SGNH hydrolase-type esterase domain-containing protein n=1 Tax=Patellaria atrata CBS 101060 TaxID=1346257 RepID=A0A9P4VVC9_9PEZI|nr:hypothetical protein M501DRAFT_970115 [Patellaria atrata CBS 101060]